MGMRRCAELHMRKGIALDAVGPALEQDELRAGQLDVRLDPRPGRVEFPRRTLPEASGRLSLVPRAAPLPVSVAAPVPG